MNKLTYIIVGFALMFTSCLQEGEIDALLPNDQETLLEMDKAIIETISYNESLVNYILESGISNDSLCFWYDNHFHFYDSLYNMHHDDYSHTYGCNYNQNGNGWMMNHGMNGNGPMGQTNFMGHMNTHDQQYMKHHIEDDYLMDSLFNAHLPYHPNN